MIVLDFVSIMKLSASSFQENEHIETLCIHNQKQMKCLGLMTVPLNGMILIINPCLKSEISPVKIHFSAP